MSEYRLLSNRIVNEGDRIPSVRRLTRSANVNGGLSRFMRWAQINPNEVARRLGVSRDLVRCWLGTRGAGRNVPIPLCELEKLIRAVTPAEALGFALDIFFDLPVADAKSPNSRDELEKMMAYFKNRL